MVTNANGGASDIMRNASIPPVGAHLYVLKSALKGEFSDKLCSWNNRNCVLDQCENYRHGSCKYQIDKPEKEVSDKLCSWNNRDCILDQCEHYRHGSCEYQIDEPEKHIHTMKGRTNLDD